MWSGAGIVLADGREFAIGDLIEFTWGCNTPYRGVHASYKIHWKISSFAGQPEAGPPFGILGNPWRHETNMFAPMSMYRPPILLPGGYSHHGIHPNIADVIKVNVDDFPARCAAAYKENLAADVAAIGAAAQEAAADAVKRRTAAIAATELDNTASELDDAFDQEEIRVAKVQALRFKEAAEEAELRATALKGAHSLAVHKAAAHGAQAAEASAIPDAVIDADLAEASACFETPDAAGEALLALLFPECTPTSPKRARVD